MKKVFREILLAAVLLFVVYNLVWFAAVYFKYSRYITGLEEIYAYRTYALVSEDGYAYNVKIPDYLSLTGNLGVQQNEDGSCALIIWPKFSGKTEYGVLISTQNGSEGIMLTENREPVSGAPDAILELVAEYQDEIDTLYEKADAMWSLDSL